MKAIWKYELPDGAEFSLEMPVGALVLSVQVQRETPCIWVMVDVDAAKEQRRFQVIGTGWKCKTFDGLKFIGTFQVANDMFVFHLFEVTP